MAGFHLGPVRGYFVGGRRHQLPSPEILFIGIQTFHRVMFRRFLPVPDLASHWSLENVWAPLCEGSFRHNMSVPLLS
jgi:hypothetical protein